MYINTDASHKVVISANADIEKPDLKQSVIGTFRVWGTHAIHIAVLIGK